jgi:2-amino-4-hydroxy-6-hydroxymethyldihydropteridine diphosphokinase
MICYIGLGSNLGNSIETIQSAFTALESHPEITLKQASSLYGSKPHGPQDQPDYINAVAKIETQLKPDDLLDVLQQIENSHNRVRTGQHWGPRTLDLDLLLYADQVIETKRLSVPHPRMTERGFVLYPLAEIEKDLILPNGNALKNYLSSLKKSQQDGDNDCWVLEN